MLVRTLLPVLELVVLPLFLALASEVPWRVVGIVAAIGVAAASLQIAWRRRPLSRTKRALRDVADPSRREEALRELARTLADSEGPTPEYVEAVLHAATRLVTLGEVHAASAALAYLDGQPLRGEAQAIRGVLFAAIRALGGDRRGADAGLASIPVRGRRVVSLARATGAVADGPRPPGAPYR